MGKVTGFLELERLQEASEPVGDRLKHYREFVLHLDDEQASAQGARCMDCGIPFCQSGCPINNIIPDWNDLVYRGQWQEAIETLHSTNNFPEFTGRICPAPCESACTLGINDDPVGIKSIEHFIIDKGWENGWVIPQPAATKTGKKVAVVGAGPAGMAAAQQLARAGHDVTVFEKNDRVGGLLRYGIPDFKMEKSLIDRRIEQMTAEGVVFHTQVEIGKNKSFKDLSDGYDAVVLAGGSEKPRDLTVPGRDLQGVHFAMDFLVQQNKRVAGDPESKAAPGGTLSAKGKHVVVIGGGDTGSDCIGTSNRHGAASVTQFEVMPKPADPEHNPVWPYWPLRLRTSSSHEEGAARDWSVSTKRFVGKNGQVTGLVAARVDWKDGKMQEIPGSESEMPADLVLLAMGFTNPVAGVLDAFGVTKDSRGNALAATEGQRSYFTSVPKVFAAGDMRRGQSLVVWAIREGRQCAREVDAFLMGSSELPR